MFGTAAIQFNQKFLYLLATVDKMKFPSKTIICSLLGLAALLQDASCDCSGPTPEQLANRERTLAIGFVSSPDQISYISC